MQSTLSSSLNGQKDHKCNSCGKSYSEAGTLKKHINAVHNGQKDHKCNSCEKAFSEAGKLKKHINISNSQMCSNPDTLFGYRFSGFGIYVLPIHW